MKKIALAKDVMTKDVISVNETDSLGDAWKVLHSHKITGAPVVDDSGCLVGVISQTDLIREAYEDMLDKFPSHTYYFEMPYLDGTYWPITNDKFSSMTVEEVMKEDVVCAEATDDVSVIANRMRSNRIHRVIITEKGRLAGIVSSLDLIKVLEAQ